MKSDLFKILGAFLLLAIIAFVGSFSIQSVAKNDVSQAVAVGPKKPINDDLSLKKYGIQWSPDGHISYITLHRDQRRYFIAGNQKSYMIESKSNMTLAETLSGKPKIKQVFGPDSTSSYRNNYATISEVLQTDASNQKHVFAFAQYEQQALKKGGTYDYSNFTASIGLLESYDGGLTWKDFGPIIRGDDYLAPGTRISGAGEPSAIIKDGYVYVYYVDWAAQTKAFHPDQIYLARTKIYPNNGLGLFEFYTSAGFSPNEANLQPVIVPPAVGDYSSLPSVSYNKYLNQYFAVYATNSGFMSSTSSDGIYWANSKQIFTFNQPQTDIKDGDKWNSYPTFLSEDKENSDQFSDKTGNLYYSEGVWPATPHQPKVKTFEIM